jgi:hypothetical protein
MPEFAPPALLAPRVRGVSSLARPRSRRAETPRAATEQGRPAAGPLAVRMRTRHRFPTAGRPLGGPQPSEQSPLAPAGRNEDPPPGIRRQRAEGHEYRKCEATRTAPSRTGWVGVIPPGGWRSHRAGASGVPDALAGAGKRRGRLMPTPSGSAPGCAVGSLAEASRAQRACEAAPGQQENATWWRRHQPRTRRARSRLKARGANKKPQHSCGGPNC